MSKLPSLTGGEVISAFGRDGFEVIRVRGSHHFMLQGAIREHIKFMHQIFGVVA